MNMNKTLMTLAVLGLTATAASAQSSITVFGVVDAAARSVKTGPNDVKKLDSDGNSSSRIGFRGEEDLGGGLKAGFWLEGSLGVDTGTEGSGVGPLTTSSTPANPPRIFNRRSTVSLSGTTYGELRLGRDNLTVWNNAAAFDPFNTVGVGTVTTLIDKLGTSALDQQRADNAVSYFLPGNLGGFYGQVQLAPGEGVDTGKTNGIRLGYKAGPLDAGLATTGINVTGGKLKQTHLGASYDFGVVKLFGQYAIVKADTAAFTRKEKVWELALTAPVSTNGTVKVGYGRASDYKQADKIAIGYQHDLSKRTALYGTYGQIKNKNANATFVVKGAPATTGALQKSSGFEVGIRHNF